MRVGGRTVDADGLHGLPPHLLTLLRDIGPLSAFVIRPLDDLVVDVSDIRDVIDLEASPREITAQNVEHE